MQTMVQACCGEPLVARDDRPCMPVDNAVAHSRRSGSSEGRMFRSKAGWVLATLYVVVSSLLLVRALQCRDGFFCGITAVPMLVPAGFAYLLLLGDHLPSPAILQWQLVVPTMSTNAVLYYLLGLLLERLAKRRDRSRAGPRRGP